MVRIKQAVLLTGVPEHTLRAWERRYGVVRTAHTPGGYRDYDAEAIARIKQMQALVKGGLPPRAASLEVERRGALGTESSVPSPSADELAHVVQAVIELDATTLKRCIDEQFALRELEAAIDDWLMPVLRQIGLAWAARKVTVAGEHLLSHIVMRKLAAAFDAAGSTQAAGPTVVGAPAGIEHELGLMAFAVCLRRCGAPVLYLGTNVPAEAWSGAISSTEAAASVTAAYRRQDVAPLRALVQRLRADHPGLPIAVGGSQQHLAPQSCLQLGHSIARGAREMAALVSS